MPQTTLDEIKQLFGKTLGVPVDESHASGDLRDLVAVDSVALLQFVVALEREYAIRFEEEWLRTERLLNLPALAAHLDQVRSRQ